MGGLGDDGDLSAHLRSRREVEGLLAETGIPVTVLRAAIVVGAGGISWEITRQLVKNLPAMIVPKWAATKTQPIALDDVVRYLVGVCGKEAALGEVFEIGGPDQLTYIEMLRVAGEVGKGSSPPIIQVPVLTPRPVLALAGAGHRRGRHHRPQPDRLDGDRGGRPGAADPRDRARRADGVRRGGAPRSPRTSPRTNQAGASAHPAAAGCSAAHAGRRIPGQPTEDTRQDLGGRGDGRIAGSA